MKKIFLFALAALALGFSGCVEDEPYVGISAVSHTPLSVTPEDAITVTATTLNVTSATLIYTVNGGAEQSVAMTGSGNTFTGTIPSQAEGSVVRYWVVSGTAVSETREFTVSAVAIDYTQLVLNEVNGEQKFIEIYNKGTVAIDLQGIKVERNEGASSYTQATSIMLPAGGFAVVTANNFAPDPAAPASAIMLGALGSGISAQQALKVTLTAPDGTTILDTFIRQRGDDSWGTTTNYDNVGAYTRYPDGTGGWFASQISSCGAPNAQTSTPIPDLR